MAGLAQATLGARSQVDWAHLVADYDRIRSVIEQVIPGFEGYNARARQPSGFVLPNGVRQRVWNTASERAEFTVHGLPDLVLKDDQYLMATVRSHDQYNTTIYGLDDRYRGIYERRVVMMSPEDIAEAGLSEGQRVDLTSHFDDGERHAPLYCGRGSARPEALRVHLLPRGEPLGAGAQRRAAEQHPDQQIGGDLDDAERWLEEPHGAAVGAHVHRLTRRPARQSRHGHHGAGDRNDKAGAGGDAQLGDRHLAKPVGAPTALGSSLTLY